MAYRNNTYTMHVTRSLAMSEEHAEGAMICICGDAIGSMVPLKNERRVIVGRDASVCNLVISNSHVSRKHLEITYLDVLKKYRVIDYSSNGTFLKNHNRLEPNREYYLEPMTELYIGSEKVIYKLR